MENRHELSLEISYVLLQDQEACKGAEHELLQSVKNPSRDVPERLGGEKGKKKWKKFLLQLQDQKKLGEFLPPLCFNHHFLVCGFVSPLEYLYSSLLGLHGFL